MNRSLPIVVVVGLLVTSAAARLEGVSIKRKVTVGQKVVWDVTASFGVNGNPPADIKEKYADVVKAVAADGTVTIETSETVLSVNGSSMSRPPSVATLIKKATGELVSYKGATMDPARWEILTGVYYPSEPVSVGDSWTRDLKANATMKTTDAKVEMKFAGEEKVGDVDTYKIEGTVTESGAPNLPGSSKSTYWLSKADGALVKQETELTNASLGPATITGSVNLTRVK